MSSAIRDAKLQQHREKTKNDVPTDVKALGVASPTKYDNNETLFETTDTLFNNIPNNQPQQVTIQPKVEETETLEL